MTTSASLEQRPRSKSANDWTLDARTLDDGDMPERIAPQTAGWKETVFLPDWGLGPIRAKLDTGALTSSIDARHIELLDDGRVRFEIVLRERPKQRVTIEADLVRRTVVKPKPGTRQRRYVVRTTIVLAGREHIIELGLVSRRGMLCRMLLGRAALAGAYLVDSGQSFRLTHSRTGAAKKPRRSAP